MHRHLATYSLLLFALGCSEGPEEMRDPPTEVCARYANAFKECGFLDAEVSVEEAAMDCEASVDEAFNQSNECGAGTERYIVCSASASEGSCDQDELEMCTELIAEACGDS